MLRERTADDAVMLRRDHRQAGERAGFLLRLFKIKANLVKSLISGLKLERVFARDTVNKFKCF